MVINLAPHNAPRALADKADTVAALGMQYVHIPVAFNRPTGTDLDLFFDAMASHHRRRLLIHCAANKRVTVFWALHRIINERVPVGPALDDILRVWHPTPPWQAFMERELTRRLG